MNPITSPKQFQELVNDFVQTKAYRDPLLFALGTAVKTKSGILASVRFPVVNAFRKNTGTAAIIMSVLGINPVGTQNVYLTRRQLQEILFYFAPFENDGKLHLNIQALKMAESSYDDKGPDSPGNVLVSFIFDEDASVMGVEDATLRLYGCSLGHYGGNNLSRSEVLRVLPNILWKDDVPIDQKSVDERLLWAAFGSEIFAPDSADRRPLLRHRINMDGLKRTHPALVNARLGGYIDNGGNFQDIWFFQPPVMSEYFYGHFGKRF